MSLARPRQSTILAWSLNPANLASAECHYPASRQMQWLDLALLMSRQFEGPVRTIRPEQAAPGQPSGNCDKNLQTFVSMRLKSHTQGRCKALPLPALRRRAPRWRWRWRWDRGRAEDEDEGPQCSLPLPLPDRTPPPLSALGPRPPA
jgi:hypothetical protein